MTLPESKYLRRAVFGLAALCLVTLTVVEFLLLPSNGSTTENLKAAGSNVVVNLLTSLIAFLVVAGVALWLFPPAHDARIVRVVSGRDYASFLAEARREATFWWFSGGLGRFSRAVTIPEMAAAARSANSTRQVVLLVLDPDWSPVCMMYANLRSSRRSGRGQTWTEASVRHEILATLLVACQWREREPLLEVELHVKQTCGLVRLEVSDTAAIRTSEDPSDSAMFFPKESSFYTLMTEDFRLERRQIRELKPARLPADIDPVSLREWLHESDIIRTRHLSDPELAEVIALAQESRNPYG